MYFETKFMSDFTILLFFPNIEKLDMVGVYWRHQLFYIHFDKNMTLLRQKTLLHGWMHFKINYTPSGPKYKT